MTQSTTETSDLPLFNHTARKDWGVAVLVREEGGKRAYVFERQGEPCRRCGTPIRMEEFGPLGQERRSYWCPRCQPAA